MSSVRIGTLTYRIQAIRGRLFLNRREVGALCDHDDQIIRYSSDLTTNAAVVAIASAVSEACRDAAVNGLMFPSRPQKIASDGATLHGPGRKPQSS